MNINQMLDDLDRKGWVLVGNVYDEQLVESVKSEFYEHAHSFREIQARKGISDQVVNASHHTLILCRRMLGLLEENSVSPLLEAFFNGKYILNTMGLSFMPPAGKVYTQNIHRDVRSFTGDMRLWINSLIMLDDSTPDNGATWLLEGSHKRDGKPDQEYFYKNAVRATGKKGDVLVFDGNIWHSAGINKTDKTRHIITPIYSRPYIKQQLDYPKAFGKDFGRIISPHLKQLLGYNALVPVTLDEFYQKDEDRFYKKDQG